MPVPNYTYGMENGVFIIDLMDLKFKGILVGAVPNIILYFETY